MILPSHFSDPSNESIFVDLHTHSTASDGTFTPAMLIDRAQLLGISILALTDHDTTDGNAIAQSHGKNANLLVLPGIELSTNSDRGTAHMLGLGINDESSAFSSLLGTIRDGRRERNGRIIQKLNLLGYRINHDDVTHEAGGDIIGRPHIARTLIRKGYFTSIQTCFEELLDRKGAGYVQRWRPDIRTAIDAIHESGGVAVLAHPGLLRLESEAVLRHFIQSLAEIGLDGLETNYSMHSSQQLKLFSDIARSFGLIQTGGSDFHGLNKDYGDLGLGVDAKHIGFDFARELLERLRLDSSISTHQYHHN